MKSNCFKAKSYLLVGGLLTALYFISKNFKLFPDFIEGFILGITLVFYAVGLYSINHDIGKLKERKRNILKS